VGLRKLLQTCKRGLAVAIVHEDVSKFCNHSADAHLASSLRKVRLLRLLVFGHDVIGMSKRVTEE